MKYIKNTVISPVLYAHGCVSVPSSYSIIYATPSWLCQAAWQLCNSNVECLKAASLSITETPAKGACLVDQRAASRCCYRWRIRRPEPRLVSIYCILCFKLGRLLHWIFICRLVVSLNGAQGTIYEGEQFQLQFRFGPKYPFDSPEVRRHGSFKAVPIGNTDTYLNHSLFRLFSSDPKFLFILTSIATVSLNAVLWEM